MYGVNKYIFIKTKQFASGFQFFGYLSFININN